MAKKQDMMSIAEIMRRTGLTRNPVKKHIDRGELEPDDEKRYSFKAFMAVMKDARKDDLRLRVSPAKERIDQAKAEREELNLKRDRGEVIDRGLVDDRIERVFGGFKKRLLGLPSALAPRLEKKTKGQVAKVLKRELAKICNEYASEVKKGKV